MAKRTNGKGRNQGLRKGTETGAPDPKLNIGSGMSPKTDKPAIVLTAQADPKTVEGVKIGKETLIQAIKVIEGFHTANDALQTLKADIDAKRGGLSDICFQLAKLGAGAADKPEHRLTACIKVFDSAEAYERQRWQKARKLAELPTAKEALGSSWQTYKSQILKCVKAGLNPGDFANGTVFREAMSQTGNKARKARQASAETATQTMTGVVESATLRAELAAAIGEMVKHLAPLPEEMQMEYAKRVHKITVAAVRELKDKDESGTQGQNDDAGTDAAAAATGVM